jgi:hypothetical protein
MIYLAALSTANSNSRLSFCSVIRSVEIVGEKWVDFEDISATTISALTKKSGNHENFGLANTS